MLLARFGDKNIPALDRVIQAEHAEGAPPGEGVTDLKMGVYVQVIAPPAGPVDEAPTKHLSRERAQPEFEGHLVEIGIALPWKNGQGSGGGRTPGTGRRLGFERSAAIHGPGV